MNFAPGDREIFEASALAMWVEDAASGEVLAVNPAALAQFRLTRSEFLGRRAEDLLARNGGALRLVRQPLRCNGRPASLCTAIDTATVEAGGKPSQQTGSDRYLRILGRLGCIGAWSLDTRSGIFECSDELCALLELAPAHRPDLEDVIAFLAPEWRARVRMLIDACLTRGKAFREDVEIVTAKHRRIWVSISAEAARNAAGEIVEAHGIMQQLIAAVDERAWNEERLRHFLDAIPAPIWSAHPDGTLDYANRVLYDYVGLSPAELHPSAWTELVHPDDRQRAIEVSDLAYRKGEPYSCEMRLRAKDGSYRWHLDVGTPLRDAEGRVIKYYGTVTDIHDIKLAEASLGEAVKLNRLILDSSAEGIHGIDANGNVIFENAAALRMLQFPESELLGRQAHSLLHHHRHDGAPYPSTECPIHRTLEDGRTRQVEGEVFFRRDGTQFAVEYTVAAIVDRNSGEVSGAVVNFRDVTERQREAELRVLEAKLLDMVSAGAPLGDILLEITLTVDRLIPPVRSSLQLIDGDGRLRPSAAPRLPAEYGRALDGLLVGPDVGSCGAAAWRREQVIVSDTLTDPLWADYRDVAQALGLRACWSTPVLDAAGRVLATFALHYDEPRSPTMQEQGFIGRICQYVRTAIERHRTAEALKESEERLRTLAENVREVFWITTPAKDRMLYVSPAYETVWGRPREELYANPDGWMDQIHPEDRKRVLAAVARQAEGGYLEEYRICRPDGSIRWISDRGFPVHGEDGSVRQIVGSARDITPRKTAEIALRERLKELGCLYRVSRLISDHGRPVTDICQDIVDTLPPALLHERIAVASIELGELCIRSHDWREPVVRLAVPILREGNQAGRVEIGYVELAEDQGRGHGAFLAEELDMIQAIAGHVGDMLEHREKAQKLTQAERLNAIGQLTGGVAHDFNNLLTVILGNAELLAANLVENSRLYRLAETTAKAAERGAELTSRLLAFARRQALNPRLLSIERQLEEMSELLRRTLGEHVEIATVNQPGLWPVMVDAGQFENAILNLGINARDAMPEGGRLTIESSNVFLDEAQAKAMAGIEPGPYVMVAVSDTGAGMDPATMERAFEPFFTTKDVGKGSGLGLSMVYGFVSQSRGHVRLESEPGAGTVVRIYLPRAAAAATGNSSSALDDERIETGTERILLVEDDDLVRDHVQGQLASLGYEVVAVRSGVAAIETLKSQGDFDLLFTDIVMPGGVSGYHLAEAARHLRPGLPILLTSGYSQSALGQHSHTPGGIPTLSKPYRRQELARKIRAILDNRRTSP
ncbi:MAG: PAS domain S-box protein [Alphaproteobacteria bacterium]|nr:PAS domain S-box protein [Alphaproteobacteria bacterium]